MFLHCFTLYASFKCQVHLSERHLNWFIYITIFIYFVLYRLMDQLHRSRIVFWFHILADQLKMIRSVSKETFHFQYEPRYRALKNSVHDVIHRSSGTAISSTLLSSVRKTHIFTGHSTWNSERSKVEETEGVTIYRGKWRYKPNFSKRDILINIQRRKLLFGRIFSFLTYLQESSIQSKFWNQRNGPIEKFAFGGARVL